MNLQQSMSLAELRVPKDKKPEQRMTALQMAKRVFKISAAAGSPFRHITPEQWAKKWLSSPEFVLTEVETDKVALIRTPRNVNKVLQDMQARADSVEPVVVDLNRNRLSSKIGYVPPVIAVDGAHRCYSQYLQGHDLMQAWVGTKALERCRPEPLIEASALDAVIAAVGGTKLDTAALLYAAQGMPAPPRQDAGDGGSQPTGRVPTVMRSGAPDGPDFIKNRGVKGGAGTGTGAGVAGTGGGPGASLGSGSGPTPKLEARRTPEARSSGKSNEPDPSDEKVPPDPSDSGQAVEPSDQLQYSTEPQANPPGVKGWSSEVRGKNNPVSDSPGSGVGPRLNPDKGASNSDLRRMKASDICADCGKDMDAAAKRIKKMWTRFTEAVAAGYKPSMEMKAAPGWEGTVKKMKSHPEIDNPWALSHWMADKGYQPGGGKKAKA